VCSSDLSGFDELKVCTAYEVDGERTERFLPDAQDLAHATPIYETVKGWDEEICDVREYNDLPEGARRYIELIEERTGLPVRLVSIGPDRAQTIIRD